MYYGTEGVCYPLFCTLRLHEMLQGVQLRLDCEDYTSAHHYLPQILDTWSRVLAACKYIYMYTCIYLPAWYAVGGLWYLSQRL